MEREQRSLPSKAARLKVERRSSGKKSIVGYAAVFYNAADPGTEFCLFDDGFQRAVERLMPKCFDRALKERADVRALFNHDANCVLGRTSAGTCRLSVDKQGLRFEIDVNEEADGARDVRAHVERGDVSGCSFSFAATNIVWRDVKDADGVYLAVREIHDCDLFDVVPVTFPAYTATSAGTRDNDPEAVRRELDRWKLTRERDSLAHYRRRLQRAEMDS